MKSLKTLADLKRDLKIGVAVIMTENSFGSGKLIGKKRYVIKTQTNGVYFSEDKNAAHGSWLEFPKADLIEYDGKNLIVYEKVYQAEDKTEVVKKMLVYKIIAGKELFYSQPLFNK